MKHFLVAVCLFAGGLTHATEESFFQKIRRAYQAAGPFRLSKIEDKTLKIGRCFSVRNQYEPIPAALLIRTVRANVGPIGSSYNKLAAVWQRGRPANFYDKLNFYSTERMGGSYKTYRFNARENALEAPYTEPGNSYLKEDAQFAYEKADFYEELHYCYYFKDVVGHGKP